MALEVVDRIQNGRGSIAGLSKFKHYEFVI